VDETMAVRVLVVDDHAPFRRAAAAVVECLEGFEVVSSVASGEESVRVAASLRPDLVLMDVNLTGMDGLEATRIISALPDAPLVLLVSTHDACELGDVVTRSGAGGFVSKSSFDADRLLEVWRASGHGAGR
jgi:DNA-binding NarL/FixJ family response regulator